MGGGTFSDRSFFLIVELYMIVFRNARHFDVAAVEVKEEGCTVIPRTPTDTERQCPARMAGLAIRPAGD
jgi:hypothetical protein